MFVRSTNYILKPIGPRTAAWIAHLDQGYFYENIVRNSYRSSLFGHLASRPEWVCSRSPNQMLQ
jgi:hypothetical protein